MFPMFPLTIVHTNGAAGDCGREKADLREGLGDGALAVERAAVMAAGGGENGLEGERIGGRVAHRPAYDAAEGV